MKLIKFFSMFLVILTVFSCSAQINGTLSADGSASMSVNMSLGQRMVALIRALTSAGGQADSLILDGQAISGSISRTPGIASVMLRNTNPSTVEGTVRISDISNFIFVSSETSRRGGFITFEQNNNGGYCQINVNRSNGFQIISLLSPEISDYLNALMAPIVTEEELSKTEYLELVASFYNKPLSDEIAASRIRASIEFPGTITAVRGGTYSGRRAEFNIALVDLLVLETPVAL